MKFILTIFCVLWVFRVYAGTVGSGERGGGSANFGQVLPGQSKVFRFTAALHPEDDKPADSGQATFAVLSGSEEFRLTKNHECAPQGQSIICTFEVTFEPKGLGPRSAVVEYQFPYEGAAPGIVTYYLSAHVVEEQQPIGQPACAKGSIIHIDSQVLRERISLVSVPFDLFYSSEHSQSYRGKSGEFKKVFFNPENWTLSGHHYYDSTVGKLYRGDGTSSFRIFRKIEKDRLMVVEEDGSSVYIFDSSGRHLETKNPLLGKTRYSFQYAKSGLLSSIVDAFGNRTMLKRNAKDSLTQIIGPFGQVHVIDADSNGMVQSVALPDKAQFRMTYSSGGLLASFENPDGRTSRFSYDGNGRLISDVGAGGESWTLGHSVSPDGLKTTVKSSASGRRTEYHTLLDQNGSYLRTEKGPDTFVRTLRSYPGGGSYEVVGNAFAINTWVQADPRFGELLSVPEGSTVIVGNKHAVFSSSETSKAESSKNPFLYESLTKKINRFGEMSYETFSREWKNFYLMTPEGRILSRTLDDQERLTGLMSGSDVMYYLSYDENGRLSSVGQYEREPVRYSYGKDGLLSAITNPLKQKTSFSRNARGLVTKITSADQRVTAFDYDPSGRLVGISAPGRARHQFLYNLMGLRETEIPVPLQEAGSQVIKYDYNTDKDLIGVTRPDGSRISVGYYGNTGLVREIVTPRGSHSFGYYEKSTNLGWTGSPDGIGSSWGYYGDIPSVEVQTEVATKKELSRLEFSFDDFHRKSKRLVKDGTGTVVSEISYVYNRDGAVSKAGEMDLRYEYPSGRLKGRSLSGVQDEYSYNKFGELEIYRATLNGQELFFYRLGRDGMGRIVSKDETVLGKKTSFKYKFDVAGRLIEVTKDGTPYSKYVYDQNGNRVSGVHAGEAFKASYDEQDRMLSYGAKSYSYNLNGEVTSVEWMKGIQSKYHWDSFGNLIGVDLPTGNQLKNLLDGKNRSVARVWDGQVTKRTIYEDDYRVAAEFNEDGQVRSSFVFATSINAPDYMEVAGDRLVFIRDHLGSPRLVVRASDGEVIQQMDYTDLGSAIQDTKPGLHPYGFAGGLYEPTTGLVRFGARTYDGMTGRWLSKDPIGFAGGDTNLYNYTLSDPVNFVDPSGKIVPLPVLWAAGGAAAGAAANFVGTLAGGGSVNQALDTIIPGAIAGGMAGALAAPAALGVAATYSGVVSGIAVDVLINIANAATNFNVGDFAAGVNAIGSKRQSCPIKD